MNATKFIFPSTSREKEQRDELTEKQKRVRIPSSHASRSLAGKKGWEEVNHTGLAEQKPLYTPSSHVTPGSRLGKGGRAGS